MQLMLILQTKTGILVGILDVGFFGVAVVATQLALKGESRVNAVGIMGAGLNIVMYGSPLAAMVSGSSLATFSHITTHILFHLINKN